MSDEITRRGFGPVAAGLALGAAGGASAEDQPKPAGPVEAAFERDYPPPGFKPGWKKPQVNRLFVQDFVIYAHSDLEMTKKLLAKEPTVLNAAMDWGAGDWETALGGASHTAAGCCPQPGLRSTHLSDCSRKSDIGGPVHG